MVVVALFERRGETTRSGISLKSLGHLRRKSAYSFSNMLLIKLLKQKQSFRPVI